MPGEFDPERFTQQARTKRDKFQFLPFGAGPRVCVAANFAMMQAQIILATLIQRFRFKASAPQPALVLTITVRPTPGVFLTIENAT